MRRSFMLGLAVLAAVAATGAEAAPADMRNAPQYLTGHGAKPPGSPNCPQCGVLGQRRPGDDVMLNPQPLPPRYLGLRNLHLRR